MLMVFDKVGIIGLGIIGSRVAEVISQAETQVIVWNRTPKAFPNFVGSPAELAKVTSFIQIFVTDGPALMTILQSMGDDLGENHIIANCSTIDPESSVKALQYCKDRGAAFLDCPFTGSKDASASGQLVYYVGGEANVLERVQPTLQLSSKAVLHVGKVGEASLLKVVTNMISATTVEVLSEAYGLVKAAGVEPDTFKQALELNACSSGLTNMKLPSIIDQDYEPHFSARNMFKDAKIGLELGKGLGVDLPALSAAATMLFKSIQKGHGDHDYSVVATRFQNDK